MDRANIFNLYRMGQNQINPFSPFPNLFDSLEQTEFSQKYNSDRDNIETCIHQSAIHSQIQSPKYKSAGQY